MYTVPQIADNIAIGLLLCGKGVGDVRVLSRVLVILGPFRKLSTFFPSFLPCPSILAKNTYCGSDVLQVCFLNLHRLMSTAFNEASKV